MGTFPNNNSKINIKGSNVGLLHKKLGVKQGKKIPLKLIAKAKTSPSPKLRQEATFADNARSWNHSGNYFGGLK